MLAGVGGSWRMWENYGGYDQEHCMHIWNCQRKFLCKVEKDSR